jgi:hypothetical protein
VALSQFVVIRSTDQHDDEQILAVNYVNGRFVRMPSQDRTLLDALANHPTNVPVSMKRLRRKLEKLHRFGVVSVAPIDPLR